MRNGITTLLETKNQIKTLQSQIEKRTEDLRVKSNEQSDLKKFIEMESIRAQETANKVENERQICLAEEAKASQMQENCNRDLEEALPTLHKA